ncbi:MAG: Bcr/CflA family drug resistance efflux transporter, partial [Burkholderiales bacterium]
AASNFVINVLGKSETGFGWLFFPLVAGMLLGSATAARLSTAIAPQRLVAAGFAAMGAASLWNVAYTAAYVARVPWAVLPITLYVFGMSLATPAMTVIAMDFFPRYRGLVSSLQSSVQMLVFAVVSGVLAPLLFDSAFKLACGMLGGVALGLLCWIGAQRLEDD